jgi:hypothetical protein
LIPPDPRPHGTSAGNARRAFGVPVPDGYTQAAARSPAHEFNSVLGRSDFASSGGPEVRIAGHAFEYLLVEPTFAK